MRAENPTTADFFSGGVELSHEREFATSPHLFLWVPLEGWTDILSACQPEFSKRGKLSLCVSKRGKSIQTVRHQRRPIINSSQCMLYTSKCDNKNIPRTQLPFSTVDRYFQQFYTQSRGTRSLHPTTFAERGTR